MRTSIKLIGLMHLIVALAACGGSGSDRAERFPPSQPTTFAASVTAVNIVRSADAQAMPITGLPADGAELTVR